MMDNLEVSKQKVLDSIGKFKLPNPMGDNQNVAWAVAVVSVKKSDMSMNYAIACNSGDGTPRVVEDFGNSATIISYGSIMPFLMINPVSDINLDRRKEMVSYLNGLGIDASEYESLPLSISKVTNKEEENKFLEMVRLTIENISYEKYERFKKDIKHGKR